MEINKNQLLRFTTAGSVDDGKSTLIGRLLYDSKSIFEDQLEAIEVSSERRGDEQVIRLEPMSILEGVELFLQRAQKASPDFTLTEQNRNIIGQIVEKI